MNVGSNDEHKHVQIIIQQIKMNEKVYLSESRLPVYDAREEKKSCRHLWTVYFQISLHIRTS